MKKVLYIPFAAILVSIIALPALVWSLQDPDPSVQKYAESIDSLFFRAIGTFATRTVSGVPTKVFIPKDTFSPSPEPVVQPTQPPVSENTNRTRLTQQDFTYIGAFRLPADSVGPSRFGYGGDAFTLNPNGDPNGSNDGYPGSLYILGHDHDQLVAEINIPVPVDQRNKSLSTLSRASFLQGFADVTGGMAKTLDQGNGFRVDGLAYLEAQGSQTSPKIYWTARTYYNVDTSSDPSHGMSETNLADPKAKGIWRLGDFSGMLTGGYIFPVPAYFANTYLGGRRLIAGLFTHQGVSATSQGPAMFAYGPWLDNGTTLSTTPLVYYPYQSEFRPNGIDPISNFPDHQIPDNWEAGTWAYTPSKHAVLIVGQRAMGETYYGEARPNDCNIYKGYHGEPYEPRILFYDPAELALVAEGEKSPTTIVPYLEWNPAQYFVQTCEWALTGAAYDENNHLLYILHASADREGEPMPLVYVFKVKS